MNWINILKLNCDKFEQKAPIQIKESMQKMTRLFSGLIDCNSLVFPKRCLTNALNYF